jgi:hypothetical protein
MDRPGHTKGADLGRLGQQIVDDKKKELRENFEDVWYIHAVAGITIVIPFSSWF